MADKFQKQIELKAKGGNEAKKNFDKVKKSADGVKNSTDKVNKGFADFAKKAASIGAVVIALKKVYEAGKKVVDLAIRQDEIYTNLRTTVEGAGKAWDNEEKALMNLFATQQAYTKFGDTDSAEMLNTLIELSGDYEASVANLALAQDLASTSSFNAQTAAKYMGMALAGNVEMLGRYIPELRSTNKEFAELTTKAEKTEYALALLQEKYGGKARAQMDSAANKIQRMKNYWGDYQEMLGDKVLPVAGKAADAVAEFFARATETDLDTTIRQLRDMGVAFDDLEPLVLMNNMLKADEALEKVGNQFDKAAKKAKNFRLSGQLVTEAVSKIDGEWTIDTEVARTDIEKLRQKTVEYATTLEQNNMKIREYERALKSGTYAQGENRESVAASIKKLENHNKGLEWSIEGTNNARRAIIEATIAYENRNKLQEQYNESLDQYINKGKDEADTTREQIGAVSGLNDEITSLLTTMTPAEIKSAQLAYQIEQFGMKAGWSEKQIKDLTDELTRFKTMFGDIPEARDVKVGFITESEFIQPLELIPEEQRIIDIDLRTDGQKFLDDYGDIINAATSIAGDFAQIYSNIIEGKYQEELKALRKSTEYQKAEYDRRKVMEEDLQASFAEERIKAFRLEQAASMGEAAISTAMAVMQALSNLPPPASYIAAATSAAMGAAQIGLIASQPVPSYEEGGLLPYNGGAQLFQANERGRESILNAQTTAWLGADGVRALNEGRSVETNYVNNLVVNLNGDIYGKDTVVQEIAEKIEELSDYGYTRISVKQ